MFKYNITDNIKMSVTDIKFNYFRLGEGHSECYAVRVLLTR